ncbi:predicted protein [Sclerotinia sclerotiorum 1980 UF-70]|uniref:Uncharacterized protein n=1 Tax=Sclerotinia sclerotiorum (strain ATCC 18683 / 1980 / Ss-1) TaxID=665079 RepID=A7F4B7_SCLS1|nr:predicted protein [Sclerotinia sclerotiorum 1980 UF-70]EDN97588.1 predicted protein [Sclerotinia sclerotiorum 1980 UF-70]
MLHLEISSDDDQPVRFKRANLEAEAFESRRIMSSNNAIMTMKSSIPKLSQNRSKSIKI